MMKEFKPNLSNSLVEEFTENSLTDTLGMQPEKPNRAEISTVDFWQTMRAVIESRDRIPPLQPISRDQNLPLSFAQERLWFVDRLKPNDVSHNIPIAFRMTGSLNVAALEQSLQEIIRRHESLRTHFTTVDGQPVQIVSPAVKFTLTAIALGDLLCDRQESETLRLATEEAQRPFDLKSGPLLRATLLQLSENESVLIVIIHQIIFDGWSESVFCRELGVLYKAFCAGEPSPLPELSIQYADFALWQRQWMQGEFLDTQLSYWKQQLSDTLPVLQLPTDRSVNAGITSRSARQTLVLSKTLTSSLKALSRQEGLTLFNTLLAAFTVLLQRYTEQDDLFVCSPTANRNHSQTLGAIGYFVNLLILRTDLSGNPSFLDLLKRVSSRTSGAYAHQDLPLQQLLNALNLVRAPLSRVMFVFQNVPKNNLKLPGLTMTKLAIDNGTTDFDLSLSVMEEGEELTAVWKYDAALFDDGTIATMMEHFHTLLAEIVANPQQPISSLLVLTEAERQQLQAKKIHNSELSARDRISASETTAEYVAPRDSLELQIAKIWEKVLGIQPIGVRDNFFELGGHSLLAAHLLTQTHKVFGKNLSLETLLQAPTIEQLAEILRQTGWSPSWSTLVAIRAGGSKTPLFCVPAAGSSGFGHSHLARHLDRDRPVYGIQAPGQDGIQNPLTQIEDLAALYIKDIRTLQPEGPYFLEGHCFGGLVAFEMAQQLHQQGEKVALLGLVDVADPVSFRRKVISGYRPQPLRDRLARNWNSLLKRGFTYIQEKANGWSKKIRKKSQTLSVKFYQRIGLPLPHKIRYIPMVEAANQAVKSYVPQAYSGRVTLFMTGDRITDDLQRGWSALVTGGFEIQQIPGNHHSALKEPHVRVLAEKLNACLDRALEQK